jgi:hypothetical protein
MVRDVFLLPSEPPWDDLSDSRAHPDVVVSSGSGQKMGARTKEHEGNQPERVTAFLLAKGAIEVL